jgi:hypothetical protein
MTGLDRSDRPVSGMRMGVSTLLLAVAMALVPLNATLAPVLATPLTATRPSASLNLATANPPLSSHNVAYVFDDSIFPCGGSGCGMNDASFPRASIFVNALTGAAPGTGNSGTYTTASGTTTVNLTNVPLSTLNTASNALSGFDTAIIYQTCTIGANANAIAILNSFLSAGNKVLIFDADGCASVALGQADWSKFVFSFTTNSPGPKGASGSYTKIEASPLTSGLVLGPQPGDAVGDANIFTTFSGAWFQAIAATNVNAVTGIVEAYARTAPPAGGGLAIYEGEDFWYTVGPSAHLRLVFDNMLGQTWNPDGLPSTTAASNITLSPLLQNVAEGTSATVTATVTDTAGTPQSGIAVGFQVASGPDSGKSGSATTGANGQATFSLVGTASGTDVVQASFTDSGGRVHSSNTSQIVFAARTSLYVAMGDSYASGEGANYPNTPGCSNSIYIDTGTPPAGNPTNTDQLDVCGGISGHSGVGNICHRSNEAHAHFVENALTSSGTSLQFLACSGAVIQDMYQAYDSDPIHGGSQQQQGELAQIAALKRLSNVRLITLTIGGNDLNFAPIAGSCAAGVLPFGDEADCLVNDHVGLCKMLYGGTSLAKNYDCFYDAPSDRKPIGISVQGKITNVHDAVVQLLRDLHMAAPGARILVVGYPRWFPVGGTAAWGLNPVCSLFPQLDQKWLNDRIDVLDATLRDAVGQSGVAEFVSVNFNGHELCTNTPWLNPVDVVANKLGNSPELLHPNPLGHQYGFAPAIVATYLAPPATVGSTGIPQVVTAGQIEAPPVIKACGVCFGGDTINLKVARSTATSVTPVMQYKWYDQAGNLLNCKSRMCDHALVKDVTGCDHDYILETDGVNGSSAFWVIRYETVGGVGGLFSTCKLQQWSINPAAPVQ